ncbi:hypothetical protein LOTGIDRAFT_171062 [Lottia gigantea]|uniref:Ephrin RBD domain-containing protein n=1 Tax=Lottia gigantea TaxID=225164 RepID=V4AIY0_LOTGI|nr:hypothetical protein LOTGIDRAFT_171062 [Lottia gigantea]ESP04089.1 hypothetical protein LOTGIDRAFT_171062 [Lottia gigantea]
MDIITQIFATSNTDHVINVNMGDIIDVICPQFPEGSDPRNYEYYTIYMVNKTQYDECTIYSPRSVMFLVNCTDPTKNPADFYTFIINNFQSIPGNPDFKRGKSYYIISTSGGGLKSIKNQFQGACYHQHMKIRLNVCCEANDTGTENQNTGSNNQGSNAQDGRTGSPSHGSGDSGTSKPATNNKTPTTVTPSTTTRHTTTNGKTPSTDEPKTDPNKTPPEKNNIVDNKIIHANGPKNVGLISDNGNGSGVANSFSVLLVTFTVLLSVSCCS